MTDKGYVHVGWCRKLSPAAFSGWQERWLRISPCGRYLGYWAKEPADPAKPNLPPNGEIVLSQVVKILSVGNKAFWLATPDREYKFKGFNGHDRDIWISKLKPLVDFTRKERNKSTPQVLNTSTSPKNKVASSDTKNVARVSSALEYFDSLNPDDIATDIDLHFREALVDVLAERLQRPIFDDKKKPIKGRANLIELPTSEIMQLIADAHPEVSIEVLLPALETFGNSSAELLEEACKFDPPRCDIAAFLVQQYGRRICALMSLLWKSRIEDILTPGDLVDMIEFFNTWLHGFLLYNVHDPEVESAVEDLCEAYGRRVLRHLRAPLFSLVKRHRDNFVTTRDAESKLVTAAPTDFFRLIWDQINLAGRAKIEPLTIKVMELCRALIFAYQQALRELILAEGAEEGNLSNQQLTALVNDAAQYVRRLADAERVLTGQISSQEPDDLKKIVGGADTEHAESDGTSGILPLELKVSLNLFQSEAIRFEAVSQLTLQQLLERVCAPLESLIKPKPEMLGKLDFDANFASELSSILMRLEVDTCAWAYKGVAVGILDRISFRILKSVLRSKSGADKQIGTILLFIQRMAEFFEIHADVKDAFIRLEPLKGLLLSVGCPSYSLKKNIIELRTLYGRGVSIGVSRALIRIRQDLKTQERLELAKSIEDSLRIEEAAAVSKEISILGPLGALRSRSKAETRPFGSPLFSVFDQLRAEMIVSAFAGERDVRESLRTFMGFSFRSGKDEETAANEPETEEVRLAKVIEDIEVRTPVLDDEEDDAVITRASKFDDFVLKDASSVKSPLERAIEQFKLDQHHKEEKQKSSVESLNDWMFTDDSNSTLKLKAGSLNLRSHSDGLTSDKISSTGTLLSSSKAISKELNVPVPIELINNCKDMPTKYANGVISGFVIRSGQLKPGIRSISRPAEALICANMLKFDKSLDSSKINVQALINSWSIKWMVVKKHRLFLYGSRDDSLSQYSISLHKIQSVQPHPIDGLRFLIVLKPDEFVNKICAKVSGAGKARVKKAGEFAVSSNEVRDQWVMLLNNALAMELAASADQMKKQKKLKSKSGNSTSAKSAMITHLGKMGFEHDSDDEDEDDLLNSIKKSHPLIYKAVGCEQLFFDPFVDDNPILVRSKILSFDWGLSKSEKIAVNEALQKYLQDSKRAQAKQAKEQAAALSASATSSNKKNIQASPESTASSQQQQQPLPFSIDSFLGDEALPVQSLPTDENSLSQKNINEDLVGNYLNTSSLSSQPQLNEGDTTSTGERLREKKAELKQVGKRLWGKLTRKTKVDEEEED